MPNLIRVILGVFGFSHCFHTPIRNLIRTNLSNFTSCFWLSLLQNNLPIPVTASRRIVARCRFTMTLADLWGHPDVILAHQHLFPLGYSRLLLPDYTPDLFRVSIFHPIADIHPYTLKKEELSAPPFQTIFRKA